MRPEAKRRLLIVDDERDLVAPLAIRLGARYEVATAYDGEEGLRRALSRPPDLALVDISMPVMDGWELCRRLRIEPATRGARIVIMTAWVSPDLARRAKEEGAARLLLKPFDDRDLMEALGESVEAA